MKKIELLAPVGNKECLIAAVEAGCDAVYLAGKMYGARAFAGNFSNDELISAINYCHLYGVKVYITINTIIYENEVDNFLNYVRFLHKNNVDAVILQDIGMFDLLRKIFPNLTLHASTQMNIHNFEGALFAKKYGFKRVILARETPLDIVKKINDEIDIETEVFIHGALCASYSGCCLLSSLIGHRSGNRGTCAQICRKKYDLYDVNGDKLNTDNYLLSTKDLCTLKDLDKIIESGCSSLKIEGRMKRKEYVYLTVSIYKKAINNYYKYGKTNVTEKEIIELKKMFNRKFTKGFMLGEENNSFTYSKRPNHLGILAGKVLSKIGDTLKIRLLCDVNINDSFRIIDDKEDKGLVLNKFYINNKLVKSACKGDIITLKYDKYVSKNSDVLLTSCYNQIKSLDTLINSNNRKVFINMFVDVKINKPIAITLEDGKNKITKYGVIALEAINKPITKEVIKKQVSKLGDTIYSLNKLDINMDDNVYVNIKDINELRRNIVEELNDVRLYKIPYIEKEYYYKLPTFEKINKKCILLNDKEEYDKYKNSYDVIYTENKNILKENTIYKIPRIVNTYEEYDKDVLVCEYGSLIKYKSFITDFSFNVVNSYSVCFLHEIGSKRVTLSYELTLKQIQNIIVGYNNRYNKKPNIEVIIDSYPEVLISKFDINKLYKVNFSYLKDEYNNMYKIYSKPNYMKIINYQKINDFNINELYKIGVNYIRREIVEKK